MKLPLRLTAAVLTTLALAACDWGYQRGVGFTGIDGEPKSIADAAARQGIVVSRSSSTIEALAALPAIRLQADAGTQGDLAKVAMSSGGTTTQNAAVVTLNGQELMLSMVEVNGQMFSVLKVPEANPGRMDAGATSAFAAAAPRLTGCLTSGGAYASGSADRPRGIAIPMNCS